MISSRTARKRANAGSDITSSQLTTTTKITILRLHKNDHEGIDLDTFMRKCSGRLRKIFGYFGSCVYDTIRKAKGLMFLTHCLLCAATVRIVISVVPLVLILKYESI